MENKPWGCFLVRVLQIENRIWFPDSDHNLRRFDWYWPCVVEVCCSSRTFSIRRRFPVRVHRLRDSIESMDAFADCLEPTMDVESNRWTDSVESFLKKSIGISKEEVQFIFGNNRPASFRTSSRNTQRGALKAVTKVIEKGERGEKRRKMSERKLFISRWINKEKSERAEDTEREREGGRREEENFDRINGQNKLSWHAREISIVWLRAKQSWRDLPGQTTIVTFPSRQMFPHHIFLNRPNDFTALLTSDSSESALRSRLRRCGWPCVKHHSCRAKENVWNQRISYQMRGWWCFIDLLVTSMLFFSYNSSYQTRAWRERRSARRTDRLKGGDQVKPFVQLLIIQRDELRGLNDNRLCVQGFSIPQAFVDG